MTTDDIPDIVAMIAARAQIEMQREALRAEDGLLCADLCRWATRRAREAVRAAGIVAGASVVAERRRVHENTYTFAMGIFLKATCIYPADANGGFTIRVHHRSVLTSGKPGRRLETTSFTLGDPGDLPDHLTVTSEVDRDAGLTHPRIIRKGSFA